MSQGRAAQAPEGDGGLPWDLTVRKSTPQKVAGQVVYAVGDIHGRYDLLRELIDKIVVDAMADPVDRRPTLIFCGDYVDRGPDSSKVLTSLRWLRQNTDFDLHLLMGNHEKSMLDFVEAPGDGSAWIGFGGAETLMSYGVEPPEIDDSIEHYIRARDQLLDRMPASHLRLLEGLELMVVIGDYAFLHAGIKPGTALKKQSEDDILWIREDFIRSAGPFEKIIVHGHTWVDEYPQILDHRIGIDTGAYLTNALTAVRLEDHMISFLQATGRTSV